MKWNIFWQVFLNQLNDWIIIVLVVMIVCLFLFILGWYNEHYTDLLLCFFWLTWPCVVVLYHYLCRLYWFRPLKLYRFRRFRNRWLIQKFQLFVDNVLKVVQRPNTHQNEGMDVICVTNLNEKYLHPQAHI